MTFWQRIDYIKIKRNGHLFDQFINDHFGDAGMLCGREVVSVSWTHRGRLRFVEHNWWCGDDCPNEPTVNYKYKLRWLKRRVR